MVDEAAHSSANNSLPSSTPASISVEDVRRIAREVATIISETPVTSNPLASSQTNTSAEDAVSGKELSPGSQATPLVLLGP